MRRYDILTLFPEAVDALLNISVIGRARRRGHITVVGHQIRDYTQNKQKQVDDYPFGGGLGMVMQADPLYNAWRAAVEADGQPARTLFLSPAGKPFNQAEARRLAGYRRLILVCGRYEGVDERFVQECVDEEISVGDYVLTGGEIAAAAVVDAVARLIPGVLADDVAFENESHWNGLLEHPQYTRPAVWRNRLVPPVLLSGNHGEIEAWRHRQSWQRTQDRRPDLLAGKQPFDEGKR